MSATELLEKVKALPPKEQTAFAHLFHALQARPVPAAAKPHRWPDFAERLNRIYGDKVTSDSQRLVDEGRGDR